MRERLTLLFLVLLRLAIGWHFMFEGIQKLRTINRGPSEISKPWTCEPFFREGTGPFAKLVRWQIGDLDDLAVARMSVKPIPPGEDESRYQPYKRLPDRLNAEWDQWLGSYARHYALDPAQLERAKAALTQEKDQTVLWFTVQPGSIAWALSGLWTDFERTPFKRSYPGGAYDVNISVSERVDEYREKLAEYRGTRGDKPYSMGKDVDEKKRAGLRSEAMALRSELEGMLAKRTEQMKSAVVAAAELTDEQKTRGPLPDAPKHWLIRFFDTTTPWLLVVVGAGLLLGLFSRLSALGGASFLLMAILTWPSLPWLAAPPQIEGNYLVVSKNVIELLALLMLACIPSGRWFGVDALIHAVNPWRNKDEDQNDERGV